MGTAAIIAAVLGLIGSLAAVSISQGSAADSDKRQFDYQKQLMDYQNELQQNTNTVATQKGHMAAAGVNPALMYSSGVPSMASVSGGTSQGTPVKLDGLLGKVDPNNVYEAIVTKNAQDMQRQRLQSDLALNRQKELNLAAQTAEQVRYTGLQKQLERTIIDQSLANLSLSQAQKENLDFIVRRGNALLPGELQQQGLLNDKIAKEAQKVVSDTLKNAWEMREIRANINRLDVLNDVSVAERGNIIESTKKSALGRIMQEFGLNAVKVPAGFRGDWHKIWHNDQIKGACAALLSLGFTPDEASSAVLYYTLDPKDVSASGINAFSRIISASLLKK